MVHVHLMFLSEWRVFPFEPCLARGKKTWWQLASRCCWKRASLDMLHFNLCNKKRLTIRHMNRPLSPILDSVLRHLEVGRAKDWSAPPRRSRPASLHILVHSIYTPYAIYPLAVHTSLLACYALSTCKYRRFGEACYLYLQCQESSYIAWTRSTPHCSVSNCSPVETTQHSRRSQYIFQQRQDN